MAVPTTVEEYLADQPDTTRAVLEQVRAVIRTVLPDAVETISYQIPAVAVNGKAVMYFAGWQKFQRAIAPYLAGKGTLKFPLANQIPYRLIGDIAVRLAAQRAGR